VSLALSALLLACAAALGVALGAAHFVTLRLNTRLYLGGGPLWRGLALHGLRLGATGAAFGLAARTGGAAVLVAVLGGFLLARWGLVAPPASGEGP
jgi:hypothetical protein